jgi:hypothetical protein
MRIILPPKLKMSFSSIFKVFGRPADFLCLNASKTRKERLFAVYFFELLKKE